MGDRDLQLLDRVLTRVACSEDDASLERVVSDVLGPVLRKLSETSDVAVKKKAIEVVTTIQGLVKPKQVKLPFDDLIDVWRDVDDSTRAFPLLFINMALDREAREVSVKRLPQLLRGIASVGKVHRQALLRSVLDLMAHLPNSRDLVADASWQALLNDARDKEALLLWMLLVLMSPALSDEERADVTGNNKKPLDSATLPAIKAGIIRLLDPSELFSNAEVFAHLLCAMGEGNDNASASVTRRRIDREQADVMDKALLLVERENPPLPVSIRDTVLAQIARSSIVCQPPLVSRTMKVALGALFIENDPQNKMKNRAVQLLRWVIQKIDASFLNPVAVRLVGSLLVAVSKASTGLNVDSFREGAYTVIGAVVRAAGAPFRSNLAIPNALVATLGREPAQSIVADALRGALYEMAPSYAMSHGVAEDDLVAFVQTLALSPSPDIRSVAGRWCKESVNTARSYAVALYLSNDDHLTVSREAKQALNNPLCPRFEDVLDAVVELTLKTRPSTGEEKLPPPLWHEPAIKYLWRCLGSSSKILEVPKEHLVKWDAFLWNSVENGANTSALPSVACQHLAETIAVDPDKILSATREAWAGKRWEFTAFNSYGGPVRADGRPMYALLAALVHAALSKSDEILARSVGEFIDKLVKTCESKSMPTERQGAALYLLGLLGSVHQSDATVTNVWKLLTRLLEESTEPLLSSSCLLALAEMSRRKGCFAEEALSSACKMLDGKHAKSERLVSEGVIRWMMSILLGAPLSVEQKSSVVDVLLKVCPASTHAEISWGSGEVLAVVFSSWDAECSNDPHWLWFESHLPVRSSAKGAADLLRPTLHRIFREPMSSGNVKQRECVAVWLCSFLRYCGPAITPELDHVQQALSILLADPSSLTRECASRGLLYAWNLGGEDSKSALLSGLVRDFGAQSKQKFDRDVFPDDAIRTPKASTTNADGDGKESYRQLAGMAKQIDARITPSLMSLASDRSVWSSSRASAFDSDNSKLIRAARNHLLPFLPKIFPTLFRGQYWPETYVAQTFRRVLRTLCTTERTVGESEEQSSNKRAKGTELNMSELLSAHFVATCTLIVSSARDKDSSVREAALGALPDLLAGRSWEEVAEFFADFWMMVLAGLDDLRETVRETASSSAAALVNVTHRFVNASHTPSPQNEVALKLVLEKLLDFGVSSAAKEVQSKSVELLKGIVKAAGSAVEPHVAAILDKLLHVASALEPEMISYLSQHTESMNIPKETLHAARAAMSRMTPLGECVDDCLKWVNEKNILDIVKSIESGLMGAGLPTLLQSSWAVTSLARGSAVEVLKGKPATTVTLGLLNVMQRQQGNTAAYRELCGAMGSIASFASSKLWSKKIIPLVLDHYLNCGDDAQLRMYSGVILHALVNDNRSSERLKTFMKDCIAIVFIGKHDSEKKVRKEFSEVFVGIGAPSSVSLYSDEILSTITTNVESNKSWAVRRQCYRALGVLASSLTNKRVATIELVVRECQASKHWKGKGSMLRALATLISVTVPHISVGELDALILSSVSALLDEMRKKGPTYTVKYRTTASKSLLSVTRETIAVLAPSQREALWKLIWPVLQKEVTGHLGDKQWTSLVETLFLVIACGYTSLPDLDGSVLLLLEQGITRQQFVEVRTASLSALQAVVKVKMVWSAQEAACALEWTLFCLADKFAVVRGGACTSIGTEEFARAMRVLENKDVWLQRVSKMDDHPETRAAIEKLKKMF